MPVSRLLVEGNLDVEILAALFGGRPPVDIGGSKGSLAPRTRDARQRDKADVFYVRDRDFDYDPPDDPS